MRAKFNVTTSWPKSEAQMRNGDIKIGLIAHIGNTHTTVRFDSNPYETQGVYGIQIVDFSYQDIPNQYIKIIP